MEIVTYFDKVFSLFISKDEINEILNKLALEVNKTYQDVNEDVILVSILDGSFIFMADLVRKLDFEFDIEFVKIRSYEGMESTGDFELLLNLQIEIEGKHILIIEDIVDTGLTIEKFIDKQLLNIDSDDIESEYDEFVDKEKSEELASLCKEENLKEAALRSVIESYIYNLKEPLSDDIGEALNIQPKLLERKGIISRIKEKILSYASKFYDL